MVVFFGASVQTAASNKNENFVSGTVSVLPRILTDTGASDLEKPNRNRLRQKS
jgi:hypothetical protein